MYHKIMKTQEGHLYQVVLFIQNRGYFFKNHTDRMSKHINVSCFATWKSWKKICLAISSSDIPALGFVDLDLSSPQHDIQGWIIFVDTDLIRLSDWEACHQIFANFDNPVGLLVRS